MIHCTSVSARLSFTLRPFRSFASQSRSGWKLRSRMVSFIKRVHPDLFAQETNLIRETNETSLQKLNELIDLCDSIIQDHSALSYTVIRGSLQEMYTFKFYIKKSYAASPDESARAAVDCVSCTLQFPKSELCDYSPLSFRNHVNLEFQKLLKGAGVNDEKGESAVNTDQEKLARERQMKDIILKRRRSRMMLKEYEKKYMDDICKFTSGRRRVTSHREAGAFLGNISLQGKHLNDFLRSGRVLFKNAMLEKQVRTLRRFHDLLSLNYDEWMLYDQNMWENIAIIFDETMKSYEMKETDYGANIYHFPLSFDDSRVEMIFNDTFASRKILRKSIEQQRQDGAIEEIFDFERHNLF